ncbi:phosphocarrier protein HPr [Rhizocola hellebori]|uniref:Phosphocarrier protein HPr n=1 Tax=Rhizocola hellebori TaxID=1392758 RepID=A0A8J3QLJ9_9ACTN|nr:HPr family phosphocarrier protein [Rhizocola hellebori]GIH11663.1 phosphocarrier protein HPr [Rhizocola hellebori]
MAERRVVVASAVGLHARPAALFVTAVTKIGLPVTLTRRDGRTADARSILAVVTLDVKCGDEVLLCAHGDDAEAALDRLAELLTHG